MTFFNDYFCFLWILLKRALLINIFSFSISLNYDLSHSIWRIFLTLLSSSHIRSGNDMRVCLLDFLSFHLTFIYTEYKPDLSYGFCLLSYLENSIRLSVSWVYNKKNFGRSYLEMNSWHVIMSIFEFHCWCVHMLDNLCWFNMGLPILGGYRRRRGAQIGSHEGTARRNWNSVRWNYCWG